MVPQVIQFIEEKIREKGRPDQISGLLKMGHRLATSGFIYRER